MPNVQVGGSAQIVEASLDATALVGGSALIIDASLDAVAQVGGVVLIVEAIESPAGQPTALRDWVRYTGRPWRPQRGL